MNNNGNFLKIKIGLKYTNPQSNVSNMYILESEERKKYRKNRKTFLSFKYI